MNLQRRSVPSLAGVVVVLLEIVACGSGSGRPSNPSILQFLLSDGSMDPCFGTGGVVTSNPGPYPDHPWRLAATPSSIFIVGYAGSIGLGDAEMRIEKRSR